MDDTRQFMTYDEFRNSGSKAFAFYYIDEEFVPLKHYRDAIFVADLNDMYFDDERGVHHVDKEKIYRMRGYSTRLNLKHHPRPKDRKKPKRLPDSIPVGTVFVSKKEMRAKPSVIVLEPFRPEDEEIARMLLARQIGVPIRSDLREGMTVSTWPGPSERGKMDGRHERELGTITNTADRARLEAEHLQEIEPKTGKIAEILGKVDYDSDGIKVRLESGETARVQKIVNTNQD